MHEPDLSPAETPGEGLTWREQEVLALLARRLTNREIGDRLHLTESTVKSHVGNILGKLYVKNRRQAVERAKELGLFKAEEKAAPEFSHALPAELTPFIGRAEALAEIHRILAGTRLLTLTGTGGVGKTRLAIRAAGGLQDEFESGVFFVSLAPISSGKHIVQTIAETVGFPISTDAPPIDQLLSYLQRRQLLLVLDNFEHLLDGVGIVAQILQAAPSVKVLATSREKLNLHGETVLSITGMNLGRPNKPADPQEYDALELLLHSIRRVRPGYTPQPAELKHLDQICQLVQGMPLAIELAAGWMNVLTPEELVREIRQDLDILTSELHDVPERHHSMRSVFDQSWSLLTQTERDVFMHLSVFRAGFTREAGQSVTGASLQALAGLVNKSFLSHDPGSGRFEIHELLRQYAQEKLEETPEDCAASLEAHATFFAAFMDHSWQHLRDRRQKAAIAEIDDDLENIRSAWRYWVDQVNAPQMRLFVNSFWLIHWFHGWNHGGEELFRGTASALANRKMDEEAETVRALALAHQGFFKTWQGFANQGFELAQESVAILERLNRPFELTLALSSLNLAADFLTRYDEGKKAASRMLEIANQLDDRWLVAFSLYKVSVSNEIRRDYAETNRIAQSSLEIYEELGEEIVSIFTLMTLGHTASALGEHQKANKIYLRCLRTSEAVGYRWGTANASKYLGRMALSLNATDQAETYLLSSLKIAEETGLGREQVNLLFELASVMAAEDRLEQAVELLAVVLQQPASQLHRLGGGSVRDRVQESLDALQARLPGEAFNAAVERGKAQEFDQVVLNFLTNP